MGRFDNPLRIYTFVKYLQTAPELKEKIALGKVTRIDITRHLKMGRYADIKKSWDLHVNIRKLHSLILNSAFITTLIKEKEKAVEKYKEFENNGLVKIKKTFTLVLLWPA